jgi:pyridinium-3,5-bisthiocarboxylic acid mononucleotide nickel chelatase
VTRVGWLHCASGISGDMLLGALASLGALDPAGLPDRLGVAATVTVAEVSRAGIAATAVTVVPDAEQPPRHLPDILDLLSRADLPEPVRDAAGRVFHRLATVEATLHQATPDTVHFHEVGGVDAIVDIAGACLGLDALRLDRLVVSPIALGGGTARTAHGSLPVPVPAVLGLLAGTALTSYGGPVDVELATPTGIAIVAERADGSGPMPLLDVEAVGSGAGGRDLGEHPNLLRLVVGTASEQGADGGGGWLTIAANVDDLDPRLWPAVLEAVLTAGAADAWLTPILMKKGRPAHTVTALATTETAAAVRAVLITQTSTIGLRESPVTKHALDRSWISTVVAGQVVRVKLAQVDGRVRNVSPEYDDVAAAAIATGLPAKEILARAAAAAYSEIDGTA